MGRVTMFCSQCGTKFEDLGAFCSQCGAKRPVATINKQSSLTPQPSEPLGGGSDNQEAGNQFSKDSSESGLPTGYQEAFESKMDEFSKSAALTDIPEDYLVPSHQWLGQIEDWFKNYNDNLSPFSADLLGFVNAEQGAIWVSTKPHYSCTNCDDQVSNFEQVDCKSCGKTESSFSSVPIGKGDGTYPVFEFTAGDSGIHFAAIMATEIDDDGPGPLPKLLTKILSMDKTAVAMREALVKIPLAGLVLQPDYALTSMGSLIFEEENFKSGGIGLPGLTQLIVSGPRSKHYLDCAEVRRPWVSSVCEVIAITRVSTLESVKPSASNPSGEVPYFVRPEVLAVLIVNTNDIEDLFPPFKKLRSAKETGLTARPDKWLEQTRVSRGDLPATWANYELDLWKLEGSSGVGVSDDGEYAALLYIWLSKEGKLHQIWNWLETRPPGLEIQLSNLDQLGGRFASLVELGKNPGEGKLNRSEIQGWFD
jgi:DNA-directed RNA polymerase subunit RPC12/RpoP